jgi:probable rRNA maturation factor
VLLTDDGAIRDLNRAYRKKDRATDVLAFPMDHPQAATCTLGDIVISLDTAARQARSRHRPLLAEVRFLLAHGLLHLIGRDHSNPEEKRQMVAWTRRLVTASQRRKASAGGERPKQSAPPR